MSSRLLAQLGEHILAIAGVYNISDAKLLCELTAFQYRLYPHNLRSHRLAQKGRSQAYWPKPCNQRHVAARNIRATAGSIGCAHSAGHHRTIQVAQFFGEGHESALLGQQEVGMTTWSLPAISCALRPTASDHPAAATVTTQPTARAGID